MISIRFEHIPLGSVIIRLTLNWGREWNQAMKRGSNFATREYMDIGMGHLSSFDRIRANMVIF